MPIVIDPVKAQAAGTRVLLREMDKDNEVALDAAAKALRDLLVVIADENAPDGWKDTWATLSEQLKALVKVRKDIKEAIKALP